MRKLVLALAVLVSLASIASAAITGSFVPVASEGGTSPPAGHVSQDLSVNATTDWTGAQLRLIGLGATDIYQDAFSGAGLLPPNSAFFGAFPTLRWDTYATAKAPLSAPSTAGGAVDIGGAAAAVWNTQSINQQWFTTDLTDTGVFTLGRFTLKNTANGTFELRLDSAGSQPFRLSGNIVNGVIGGEGPVIPEPSSAILSVMGLFSMLAVGIRRRKK